MTELEYKSVWYVLQKKNLHLIRIFAGKLTKNDSKYIHFHYTVDDYFLILYEDWSIYLIKIFTHEITKIKIIFYFFAFICYSFHQIVANIRIRNTSMLIYSFCVVYRP